MDLTFQPSYSEGWLRRGRKCARPVEDPCSNPDLPLWAPWPWAYYSTSLSLFFHLKDGSHSNYSQSCSKWYSILKFVLCSYSCLLWTSAVKMQEYICLLQNGLWGLSQVSGGSFSHFSSWSLSRVGLPIAQMAQSLPVLAEEIRSQ